MIRRLRNCEAGGATVEFAIFAPFLLLFVAMIGLLAAEFESSNKAADAVRVGAHYVMQGGQKPAAVRDVTLASWNGAPGAFDVAVDQYCACGSQVVACPGSCGADPAARFTRIRGSASVLDDVSGETKLFVAQQVVRTR